MTEKSDANRLAVGFVECTTEYDYAEVPERVQELLGQAAEALSRWIATQGVYRIEPHANRSKLEAGL